MSDPTYETDKIAANPVWRLASMMSEWLNDNAPIGWGRYIPVAEAIRNQFLTNVKERDDYQVRVHRWMMACFGDKITFSQVERNYRFLEEALELIQARGGTADEAHKLVDYVFARPAGDSKQEVGGVLVCLAALCSAADIDMEYAGETELTRIWSKIEQIRTKHAGKPQAVRADLEITPAEVTNERWIQHSTILTLKGELAKEKAESQTLRKERDMLKAALERRGEAIYGREGD